MINNSVKSLIKYYCNELYNNRQIDMSFGFLFGISQMLFASQKASDIDLANAIYYLMIANSKGNERLQLMIDIDKMLDKE